MRITHLVNELFGHRLNRNPSASFRMLGHNEATIWTRFNERVTDIRQIGNGAPVVKAVTARALGAALDYVSRYDPCRQLIPL